MRKIKHKESIINGGFSLNEIACILTQLCMEYDGKNKMHNFLERIEVTPDMIYFETVRILE